jgi:antitoxin (DNA-binding transcriptional repressor) of toxin-antitoxin stability system
MFPMRSVGIKVLKNRLSEYVRLAAQGETVLVTDRDRVVAELGPPRTATPPVEARLAELARAGLVTPARITTGTPPRHPVAPTEQILGELDADREDR